MTILCDMSLEELFNYQASEEVLPVIALDSFSLEPVKGSSLEEIIKASQEYRLCVDASGLVVESRLSEFEEAIKRLLVETKDDVIFSDLAVFNLLKEYKALNRGIYAPETLIMNSYDLAFYSQCGVTIGLSLENSKDELYKMAETGVATMIDIWGYHRYLVTPRQVITAYNDGNHVDLPKSGVMRENNRCEWYHIEENENGTWVLSPKPFAIRRETLNKIHPMMGRIKRYNATWELRDSIIKAYLAHSDAFTLGLELREAPMMGETVLTKVK